MTYQIAFARREQAIDTPVKVLAADIGGTKTDLALIEFLGTTRKVCRLTTYQSKAFDSFAGMIRQFTRGKERIDRCCIGIAGPVLRGKAQATNLNWGVDVTALENELEIGAIHLLNDLEATAYGLAALDPEEMVPLVQGHGELLPGNAAIIAPGTGLGEAGLYWDGKVHHPFSTEGGHASFGPSSEIDAEVWRYLRRQFGHVSWERVVSGPGLLNIYQFLLRKQAPARDELPVEIDDPKSITRNARSGDPTCLRTLELFFRYLATEAANLALKYKATGGVLIGGGMIPELYQLIDPETFRRNFVRAGRLQPLLESIPIQVILNKKVALLGAACYAAFSMPDKKIIC